MFYCFWVSHYIFQSPRYDTVSCDNSKFRLFIHMKHYDFGALRFITFSALLSVSTWILSGDNVVCDDGHQDSGNKSLPWACRNYFILFYNYFFFTQSYAHQCWLRLSIDRSICLTNIDDVCLFPVDIFANVKMYLMDDPVSFVALY